MNLNVALFNDSFPPTIDGVANATLNYAKYINQNHGTATVVTPKYPNVIDDYEFEVYRYNSVNIPLSIPYRVGNPFSPSAINDLMHKNFNLLHVHCPFASASLAKALVVGKKNRKPIIFTYHTKFEIDIDRYVSNVGMNKISKKFILNNINSADEVWAVSKGTVQSLRNIGYKGDVVVMENGTDFKKGRANDIAVNAINRMYSIDPAEKVLLFVGRTMWYKNIKIILDAVSSLYKNGYKFKTVFVGDGPDRPSIEQYAKRLGIYDNTIFTGSIYDRQKVKAFFTRADLFLFPSTYDTSGLVVKEAAACSCPSILIKDSCASEGIEDMVSGLLCEENAESFAEKIASVLNNDCLLKNIGKCAEEKVYCSWETSVQKAVKRYEIVLENFNKSKR